MKINGLEKKPKQNKKKTRNLIVIWFQPKKIDKKGTLTFDWLDCIAYPFLECSLKINEKGLKLQWVPMSLFLHCFVNVSLEIKKQSVLRKTKQVI